MLGGLDPTVLDEWLPIDSHFQKDIPRMTHWKPDRPHDLYRVRLGYVAFDQLGTQSFHCPIDMDNHKTVELEINYFCAFKDPKVTPQNSGMLNDGDIGNEEAPEPRARLGPFALYDGFIHPLPMPVEDAYEVEKDKGTIIFIPVKNARPKRNVFWFMKKFLSNLLPAIKRPKWVYVDFNKNPKDRDERDEL